MLCSVYLNAYSVLGTKRIPVLGWKTKTSVTFKGNCNFVFWCNKDVRGRRRKERRKDETEIEGGKKKGKGKKTDFCHQVLQ